MWMRLNGCPRSPRNLLHSITPPLLILLLHIQRFIIIIMQLFISALVSRSRSRVFLLQWGFSTLLFLSLAHGWNGPEGKRQCCLLELLSLHDTEVSGTGREAGIFYPTLSLSVETSGRPLWHTWLSAAMQMMMAALLYLLQLNKVWMQCARGCGQKHDVMKRLQGIGKSWVRLVKLVKTMIL